MIIISEHSPHLVIESQTWTKTGKNTNRRIIKVSRFSKLVMIFVDLMQHSLQNIKIREAEKKMFLQCKKQVDRKSKF